MDKDELDIIRIKALSAKANWIKAVADNMNLNKAKAVLDKAMAKWNKAKAEWDAEWDIAKESIEKMNKDE